MVNLAISAQEIVLGSGVDKCKRLSPAIWQAWLGGICLAPGKQTVDKENTAATKFCWSEQAQHRPPDPSSLTRVVQALLSCLLASHGRTHDLFWRDEVFVGVGGGVNTSGYCLAHPNVRL